MGDAEEADYDAGLSGVPTELAPSADVTSANTAWALDDGYEEPRRRFSAGQITAMAVAAAVILTAGAGVVAWQHLRGGEGPREEGVTAASTMVTSVAPTFWGSPRSPKKPLPPPPPPVQTVTVTAPPPPVARQVAIPPSQAVPVAPSVIAGLIPYNERFLAMIQQRGWAVWDRELMLERAHSTCSMLRDGENPDLIANKLMGVEAQLSWQMAAQFVGTVRDAYPNCN